MIKIDREQSLCTVTFERVATRDLRPGDVLVQPVSRSLRLVVDVDGGRVGTDKEDWFTDDVWRAVNQGKARRLWDAGVRYVARVSQSSPA